MKKAILVFAGLAGITITANAQKLTASKVPTVVKAAFAKAHPEVKVITWEKEKSDFEAGFKFKGQEISENYTAAGQLLESEIGIKPNDLPKTVKDYIAAHYKGAKIKEAAKITKADGMISYEAEINGKDILFDAKGNPLK